MSDDLKLSHIRAISNSTEATRVATATLTTIQRYTEANKNFGKVQKALEKLPEDVRPLALAALQQPSELKREARQTTAIFYNGILNNIRKNLDKYSDDTFRTADDAKLLEIYEFSLSLYKMFPQAFPVPSKEKSA